MKHANRLPRRAFLQQATRLTVTGGAVLWAPHVFWNRTRAQTGESPSEAIRVGIIGVGGQGRSNMSTPTMAPHVVAVCDVDRSHVAEAQKQLKAKTGYDAKGYCPDYRRMLEDKDIDAVLIATPDHWHALPAIHACQAGKDVYVEKPLTLTVHEGWAMVKAARYYKRIVQTGSQQRSWSDQKFRRACEYVRSGRIGDIKTVRVGLPGVNWTKDAAVPDGEPPAELDYPFWLGPAPFRPYNKHRVHYYFRFFWDYSGGQMTNWGAHHLDITQWGLGMDESGPVEIEARAEFDPQKRYEVPSWFEITYTYASGIKVLCGQSHRIGTTFQGQDGIIYVDRGRLESTVKDALAEPLAADEVQLSVSRDHHKNWFDSIKSRQLPICDVAIGHRSATVCHLGNIAVRTGRRMRWDPAKEQIVGDDALARHLSYEYRKPWELPKIPSA
ncbi:MAG TPA: Gfo/Idh/MocA family oxidoreductase [Verrucomicrobiota bacterium]|nr:Gfo/Idh/MocA family oxidoreductase [Verrucomicrobiota bacterium]HNU51664.1 Gfo/Idh/MocA family oxidoreductase [Verrucomicrobiota bacterium]